MRGRSGLRAARSPSRIAAAFHLGRSWRRTALTRSRCRSRVSHRCSSKRSSRPRMRDLRGMERSTCSPSRELCGSTWSTAKRAVVARRSRCSSRACWTRHPAPCEERYRRSSPRSASPSARIKRIYSKPTSTTSRWAATSTAWRRPARTYFGEPASDLDLAQASLLAAIPNDPARLAPDVDWKALRERQKYVLDRMVALKSITSTDAGRAFAETLRPRRHDSGIFEAAHALFYLYPQIAPSTGRVRTTIDAGLQRFVQAQTEAVIVALGAHHGDRRRGDRDRQSYR